MGSSNNSDISGKSITDERESRLKKLGALKKAGVNPYPNFYKSESYSEIIKTKFHENGEIEFKTGIAGRVILLRDFGKAVFATIKDDMGQIQIYARQDILGKNKFSIFKLIDTGDIIGVRGNVFKTHKGEITVLVEEFKMLAKTLNALPEKWHGLTDVELRYRQRYLDLIVNDKVRSDFISRFKIVNLIRKFLNDKEFLEVETPMMQTIPGGAAARPFITHHNALDMDLFLRIAPELYLKRLIVGGFEKVFELNRNFRNEGIDTKHNPEFTMLELYQAYASCNDMISLFEEMMLKLAAEIKGSPEFEYQGLKLDFSKWEKIKYVDALKNIGNVPVDSIGNQKDALDFARARGFNEIKEFEEKWSILNLLFEGLVEPELIFPTIVYEYPAEISPLAKNKENDAEFVERFEPFVAGRELGNAFSELNDPILQAERFFAQAQKKAKGDDRAMFVDEDYINALEFGMPPTGGMGIGIDRLVMIFINSNSIRDTILFPTLKSR
jgi:lysyl-tRNA synthetase class 2